MAGVAIAIMSAVAALAPVIPPIVQAVEHAFGKGTGETKLQTATKVTQLVAEGMAAAGKLGGPAPTEAQLMALVESTVQDLKARNLLPAPVGGGPDPQEMALASAELAQAAIHLLAVSGAIKKGS